MKRGYHGKFAFLSLLILAMLISACSSGKGSTNESTASASISESASSSASATSSASTTPEPPKPVTLKIFVGSDKVSVKTNTGVQDDLVAKEIANRTGVTMDLDLEGDGDTLKLAMASGDLPDIVMVQKQDIPTLIQGGLIIPLDDLLPEHGKDIMAVMPKAIEFNKKYYSNDTGKLYSIPNGVGKVDPSAKAFSYGSSGDFNIRWDYYKELGYPAYNNYDELLNILAEMQKKHPTNAKGQKIWAVSPFFDFGIWAYYSYPAVASGTLIDGAKGFSEIKQDGTVDNYVLDVNSPFWDGVKFYNKANQLGILDPEAFTQKFDNFQSKSKEGRVLFSFIDWMFAPLDESKTDPLKGYMTIPALTGKYLMAGYGSSVGQEWKQYVISKNCKDPERAMDLINFLSSYEGSELIYSGVKDVHWTEQGGKAVITDETIKASIEDPDFVLKTGIGKYANLAGISSGVIDPKYGQDVNLFNDPAVFEKKLKPIEQDYCEHYGCKYPGEVSEKLAEQGKLTKFFSDTTQLGLLKDAPDDLARMKDAILDYLMKTLPKAVLAKTDAEYEKEKQEIIDEAKKMGLDTELAPWHIKNHQDAIAEAKQYQ